MNNRIIPGHADVQIRVAKESDVVQVTQLFRDTIQSVNCRDYTQEEVDDWASWHSDHERWKGKIVQQYFIIAVCDQIIVGFASLDTTGYLDFMFIHKDFQRRGIALKLLQRIEQKADEQRNEYIFSDVSITARSFFESQGFEVQRQQLKKSREKELINYRMIKYCRQHEL